MRDLHDCDSARAGDARNPEHGGEYVQPPRHPPNVQLAVGQAGDRRQATAPAGVVRPVADHMLGADGRRHPPRVGEGTAVVDAQPKVRAHAGTTQYLFDGTLQFGGLAVECVEHEVVIGDFGRHPIELRIDGRHLVCRHRLSPGNR